jgi:hypothetical protein
MCTYICNTYSGWPCSSLTSIGCTLPDHIFPSSLYYICSPDSRLASPMPLHSTSTHLIISWTPYLTISLWQCHPFTLTAVLVGDSARCYLYHSPGLWLGFPSTLTLLPVPDSVLFPLTFLCTTTYSLVCAQFPYVYKPPVAWLYSLTWIYLVLHGYLVHNL